MISTVGVAVAEATSAIVNVAAAVPSDAPPLAPLRVGSTGWSAVLAAPLTATEKTVPPLPLPPLAVVP